MKELKSEFAALERMIQLEPMPPTPETAQEQQANGRTARTQSPSAAERATTETISDAPNRLQFLREHVQPVKPTEAIAKSIEFILRIEMNPASLY